MGEGSAGPDQGNPDHWKKCSACKRPIGFGQGYYVCSVSTCNRKRTGLRFCTVSCWEVHLPVARHREAWAEERTAPATAAADAEAAPSRGGGGRSAPERPPRRTLARPAGSGGQASGADETDVLVIASRLKDYVRAVSGMNTSDRVLGPLSDVVREAADRAIERARADGRKTILERDLPRR